MTFEIYAMYVIPISAFFSASLWFGNTVYLFISVAFIQMLKALMPVPTFIMAIICGTDKVRCDVFLVSVGVVVSSYGEIQFNVVGTRRYGEIHCTRSSEASVNSDATSIV